MPTTLTHLRKKDTKQKYDPTLVVFARWMKEIFSFFLNKLKRAITYLLACVKKGVCFVMEKPLARFNNSVRKRGTFLILVRTKNEFIKANLPLLSFAELQEAERSNKESISFFSEAKRMNLGSFLGKVVSKEWSRHMHRRKLILQEYRRRGLNVPDK